MRTKKTLNLRTLTHPHPSYLWHVLRRRVGSLLGKLGMPPSVETSCACWMRETGTFHTRVTYRNYFSANYKIPNVTLTLALYGADGTQAGTFDHPLGPDETLVVEGRDLLKRFGLAAPFEGNLFASTMQKGLVPDRVMRANVDYYDDGRFISTVHEQGKYLDYTRDDAQHQLHVYEDADHATSIVVQNCYRWRHSPADHTSRVRIEVTSSDGRSRDAKAAGIPACGAREIRLGECFPDLPEFLGGRVGSARIFSDVPIGRCVGIIRTKSKDSYSMSHSVGDDLEGYYRRDVVSAGDLPPSIWAPILPSLFVRRDWINTRSVFMNTLAPEGVLSLDVRLHDHEGKLVIEVPAALVLQPRASGTLELDDLLARAGRTGDFTGSAEFRCTPSPERKVYPTSIKTDTEYVAGPHLATTANESFRYLNSKANTVHDFQVNPRRTKMHSRVIAKPGCETWLLIVNGSSDVDYATPSNTQLLLYRPDGKEKLEKALSIPGHGVHFAPLSELFPNVVDYLAPCGTTTMVIADKDVKLLAFHVTRDTASGAIAVDHFFGG